LIENPHDDDLRKIEICRSFDGLYMNKNTHNVNTSAFVGISELSVNAQAWTTLRSPMNVLQKTVATV
jgi:hypothetical protein